MKGQKIRGRASAGPSRSPRGTPPYPSERQRDGSQLSLGDAGEALRPVPETGALSVSELFRHLPRKLVSKPGIRTHVIDGYVIQESNEPFSTADATTSDAAAQHHGRVSSDAPSTSLPASGTTVDPGPSRARPKKSTPSGRQGRKAVDPFRVKTQPPPPSTTRTPAATLTVLLTPERTPTLSPSEKTAGVPTSVTPSAAHIPDAKSKGNVPPKASASTSRGDSALQVFITPPLQPAPPPPPSRNSPEEWTVEDVAEYISGIPEYEHYAEKFRYHEIDGDALFLLKEHHLMTAMNMKLGPALKMCAVISSLRALP